MWWDWRKRGVSADATAPLNTDLKNGRNVYLSGMFKQCSLNKLAFLRIGKKRFHRYRD